METDSERMRKRAETALEIAKDLFDDEEDENEEDESETEDCRLDDALEDRTDDTFEEDDAAYDDPDQLPDAKTDTDIEDADTSKEKKKMLKTISEVIFRPIVSKFKWNLNVNLDVQASNHNKKSVKKNSKRNRDTPGASEPTKEKADNKQTKSDDAVKIENLTKKNNRLVKLADRFLNECIELKAKNFNLSEDIERSRLELIDEKKTHEKKYQELVDTTEEHAVEIKRSKAALSAAQDKLTKEVERSRKAMIDEKRTHEEKYQKLVATTEEYVAEINRCKTALCATDAKLSKIMELYEQKTMELKHMEKDHDALITKCNNLSSELTITNEEHSRSEKELGRQLHKMESEKSEMINTPIIAKVLKEKKEAELRAESEIRAENVKISRMLGMSLGFAPHEGPLAAVGAKNTSYK